MSTGTMPIVLCDDLDGCEEWSIDYHAQTADSVGGVRVTSEQPAPGWARGRIDGLEWDFCPAHTDRLNTEAAR